MQKILEEYERALKSNSIAGMPLNQDALQAAIESILKNPPNEPDKNPKAYLKTVYKSRLYNLNRNDTYRNDLINLDCNKISSEDVLTDTKNNIVDGICQKQERKTAADKLIDVIESHLKSDRLKSIFHLKYFEGQTVNEISEELDVSRSTVKRSLLKIDEKITKNQNLVALFYDMRASNRYHYKHLGAIGQLYEKQKTAKMSKTAIRKTASQVKMILKKDHDPQEKSMFNWYFHPVSDIKMTFTDNQHVETSKDKINPAYQHNQVEIERCFNTPHIQLIMNKEYYQIRNKGMFDFAYYRIEELSPISAGIKGKSSQADIQYRMQFNNLVLPEMPVKNVIDFNRQTSDIRTLKTRRSKIGIEKNIRLSSLLDRMKSLLTEYPVTVTA